jgi:hypothetical protein
MSNSRKPRSSNLVRHKDNKAPLSSALFFLGE